MARLARPPKMSRFFCFARVLVDTVGSRHRACWRIFLRGGAGENCAGGRHRVANRERAKKTRWVVTSGVVVGLWQIVTPYVDEV